MDAAIGNPGLKVAFPSHFGHVDLSHICTAALLLNVWAAFLSVGVISRLYSSAAARLMGKCPLSNLLMFFIWADSDASRSLRPPYLIVNITLLEVSLGVLPPPP